jgi:hypothetical protein
LYRFVSFKKLTTGIRSIERKMVCGNLIMVKNGTIN